MDDEIPYSIPAIDRIANGESFLILKAILPYLNPSMQKMMAVYVKTMELNNIMDFYNKTNDMSICTLEAEHASPVNMLQDIRQFCNLTQKNAMDQCIQMFQMFQIFHAMNDGSGDGPQDILSSLLSPEQQEMFQTYQSMFDAT